MPTGYQIKEQDRAHYITLQVVKWIDLFTRQRYRDILIENIAYCQKHKGLELFAWVIMSNHVHLIVRSANEDLSGLLRDFKSYTSKEILKEIQSSNESRKDWLLYLFKNAAIAHQRNADYQIWTHENHAEILLSNAFIQTKLDYIHNNPVRAGIVANPIEYRYSSASAYADEKGLLDVILIDRQWKTYS